MAGGDERVKADDPRHGQLAGYRAHRNAKEEVCDSCRRARNAYSRSRPPSPRGDRSKFKYINSGYDEADGLVGGRWMWDDQRSIRVWVATGEVESDAA